MSFPFLIAIGGRSTARVVPSPSRLRELVIESRAPGFVVQFISPATIEASELLQADLTIRRLIDAALSDLAVKVASSRLSFHRGVFDLEIVLSWSDRLRN